jgi:hypothetical protein
MGLRHTPENEKGPAGNTAGVLQPAGMLHFQQNVEKHAEA